MEFMFAVLIVAIGGGVLGYFAGKKHKTANNRKIEAVLLCAALGLAVYAAVKVSTLYLVCVVLLAGELIGMAVPRKKG